MVFDVKIYEIEDTILMKCLFLHQDRIGQDYIFQQAGFELRSSNIPELSGSTVFLWGTSSYANNSIVVAYGNAHMPDYKTLLRNFLEIAWHELNCCEMPSNRWLKVREPTQLDKIYDILDNASKVS